MTRIVVERQSGQWKVSRDGVRQGTRDRKHAAEAFGEELAEESGGTLIVRSGHGEPERRETFTSAVTGAGPGEI